MLVLFLPRWMGYGKRQVMRFLGLILPISKRLPCWRTLQPRLFTEHGPPMGWSWSRPRKQKEMDWISRTAVILAWVWNLVIVCMTWWILKSIWDFLGSYGKIGIATTRISSRSGMPGWYKNCKRKRLLNSNSSRSIGKWRIWIPTGLTFCFGTVSVMSIISVYQHKAKKFPVVFR